MSMKQMEVTIMGQSYMLGCPEGGESDLLEAVSRVDREMSAIRDAGKVKARERIAVLAALNLGYQLASRPPAKAAVAPVADGAVTPAPPSSIDIHGLVQRLDEALNEDGLLF